jgi:hypothetical protein
MMHTKKNFISLKAKQVKSTECNSFLTASMQLKSTLSIALILFYGSLISAQPAIQWQKTYGGSSHDQLYSIQQTTDGGYISVGVTTSNNGDVFGNHGGFEFWVVKLTENGSIQWKKAFGGSNNDWPYSIQQTNDGGYIMSGMTMSNNGNVSGNHGDRDGWVVKLNEAGGIQWAKTLGGSGPDEAWSVIQTSDGGYIVAGSSGSNDGDVTLNHGFYDVWIVKLSEAGAIQWQKSLGGSNLDGAKSIIQTADGGYILAGESMSNDGNVSVNHGNTDFWIVKIDEEGAIEWEKSLGGIGLDVARSVCQLNDGSYVVGGYVGSDVPGHHGDLDYWVIKMSNKGEVLWQKAYGGSSIDQAFQIQKTTDGGVIVMGETQSVDGDVLDNDGGKDIWVLKLNDAGDIEWQKTLGGTMAEGGLSVGQTSDGGYILGGYTWSIDGDVTGSINRGNSDFWVVKLAPESVGTNTSTPQAVALSLFPNPATHSINIQIPTTGPFTETTPNQASSPVLVTITDLLGRECSTQTITNGGNVNLATLPNGFYLLTATTSTGQRFVGKFRKQE